MSDDLLPIRPDTGGLESLSKKLELLRDLVAGVARGYKTGLFVYGSGGVGKSYTTISHLKKLEIAYHLHNSRMTAKGLFLTLDRARDAVHVLEDMERLTKDADAQGVLRSALWAQPGHGRVVTWTTATDEPKSFEFRGGLILISNRPLADLPELRALATRIEVHRLEVTEAEMTALMRDLAARGHRLMDKLIIEPKDCSDVTEHLLQECRACGCPLDLRLQQKSFQTYLQWESGNSACHWRDLVAASVREAAHQFRHAVDAAPLEAKRARLRNLIREIVLKTKNAKEQERLYTEATGKSRADFFRRKREVESGDFDEQDAA